MTRLKSAIEKRPLEAPSLIRALIREIYNDKLALISLSIFTVIAIYIFVAAALTDPDSLRRVNLHMRNSPPMPEYLLGTDPSGRDILQLVTVGARNSLAIALLITLLTSGMGIVVGLASGYYGGRVDNAIMRILDFLTMLPRLMLVIVVISLLPAYNPLTFVLVVSALGWMYPARLFRAKALQQSSLDYVSAAKALGSSNFRVMFRHVLPNISSIIIVDFTLALAMNVGVETGLTFLGFGLPFGTPSLGALIAHASSLTEMQNRPWQWLPAALLSLVLMLCINFVGHAVKRAANVKQIRGGLK
jgi:peptide/nickel transport system permease protein